MKSKKPIIISLAPFQGLTDKYFRTLFLESFGGVDRVYAPFVSGSGTERISKSKLSDLLMNERAISGTIPQIISNDSDEIVLFGKTLSDYGYRHINWNLGCPFRRIANKNKGCGLLPYPGKLEKILDNIFDKQPSFELSIKTRLGYHQKDEIFEAIKLFNQYPLSELIIHPRIGKQLYKGVVNLEGFNQCKLLSDHSIVYNGDIYNKAAFEKLLVMFSDIEHWMMGRGLLINPFLAEQIKGQKVSKDQRRERLHKFIKRLMDITSNRISNESKAAGYMKAVCYYMAGSFKDPEKVFSKIKKTRTTEEFDNAFNEIINLPLSNDVEAGNYFVHGLKHI